MSRRQDGPSETGNGVTQRSDQRSNQRPAEPSCRRRPDAAPPVGGAGRAVPYGRVYGCRLSCGVRCRVVSTDEDSALHPHVASPCGLRRTRDPALPSPVRPARDAGLVRDVAGTWLSCVCVGIPNETNDKFIEVQIYLHGNAFSGEPYRV